MLRFGGFVLVALLAGTPALADVVSAGPDFVAIALYHEGVVDTSKLMHPDDNPWIRDQGLAFIVEKRTIDLPAGPSVVNFRGVAATMVPQTADIQGLPAGVIERNFDYDLLSPGSLLAKSIGETVHVVRTNPKTGKPTEETAVVRSGPNGAVLEIAGTFEALRCSGLPERLTFDRIPDGLSDTPTLSVRTVAQEAGRYTITLSYIATGLDWSADYVARLAPDGKSLALTGWLTLANFSTTSFPHVPIDAIAGNLEKTGKDTPIKAAQIATTTNCWPTNIDWAMHAITVQHMLARLPPPPPAPPPAAGVETVTVTAEKRAELQELGDYKLYALPEPTTLAAQQIKQVQFLDQPSVTFSRVYRYTTYDEPDEDAKAEIVLKLQNRDDTGLGKPLPAGSVSVFEPAAVGAVFTGEDTIGDTSVGLPLNISTGNALDVRVVPTVVERTTSGNGRDKKEKDLMEIAIENDKPIPVSFELRQALSDGTEIVSEFRPHTNEAGYAVWHIPLDAGARLVLRYTAIRPA